MTAKKAEHNDSSVPSILQPNSGQTNSGQGLRKRAEEKAEAMGTEDQEAFWPEEARHLLYELQVHQIELEMQNEELRRTQQELETSQARYFDVYNLAPVGYCTLSQKGLIVEANNTLGNLTGYAKNRLIGSPFPSFIHRDTHEDYYLHYRSLLKNKRPQTCELKLLRKDAPRSRREWTASSGRGVTASPSRFGSDNGPEEHDHFFVIIANDELLANRSTRWRQGII